MSFSEEVLDLWQARVSAAAIGKRYGKNRDWVRGIVRRAAAAGDERAISHGRSGPIGAERQGYTPKTRSHYYEIEKSRKGR
jgi:hypothetical protein